MGTIKYKKFIEIEKSRSKYLNERDMFLSDLAILEEKPLSEIKDMTFDEINKLVQKYDSFYKALGTKKLDNKITIDGKTETIADVESLSFGKFIDLEEIMKSDTIDGYKKVPMILAILLVREKDDVLYKKKFEEYVEKIENCDFADVLACSGFFLHREKLKTTNSPTYLKNQIVRIKTLLRVGINDLLTRMTDERKNLRGFTGGIRSFSIYLMMTCLNRLKSRI